MNSQVLSRAIVEVADPPLEGCRSGIETLEEAVSIAGEVIEENKLFIEEQ